MLLIYYVIKLINEKYKNTQNIPDNNIIFI